MLIVCGFTGMLSGFHKAAAIISDLDLVRFARRCRSPFVCNERNAFAVRAYLVAFKRVTAGKLRVKLFEKMASKLNFHQFAVRHVCVPRSIRQKGSRTFARFCLG